MQSCLADDTHDEAHTKTLLASLPSLPNDYTGTLRYCHDQCPGIPDVPRQLAVDPRTTYTLTVILARWSALWRPMVIIHHASRLCKA